MGRGSKRVGLISSLLLIIFILAFIILHYIILLGQSFWWGRPRKKIILMWFAISWTFLVFIYQWLFTSMFAVVRNDVIWLAWICDDCTWHHKTFPEQLHWHLAIKLYCVVLYQAYPDSLGVTVCGKCYYLRCNKLWKLRCDTATWIGYGIAAVTGYGITNYDIWDLL